MGLFSGIVIRVQVDRIQIDCPSLDNLVAFLREGRQEQQQQIDLLTSQLTQSTAGLGQATADLDTKMKEGNK